MREIYQALSVSARRLQIQIDDLLDFALIERGELELRFKSCSINQIVRDVVDLYSARAAEKHITLTLNLPPTAQLSVVGRWAAPAQCLNARGGQCREVYAGEVARSRSAFTTW